MFKCTSKRNSNFYFCNTGMYSNVFANELQVYPLQANTHLEVSAKKIRGI